MITMTTSNPFAARLRQLADEGQGGYLPRSSRVYTTAWGRKVSAAPAFPVAEPTATPKQVDLINRLLDEKDLTAETRPAWHDRVLALAADRAQLETLTRTKASALIDHLLAQPAAAPKKAADAVPAGRYAVRVDDVLVFFKVDVPVEGRWAGYTFVERQLSDDFVRIPRALQAQLLSQLREDGFEAASKLYGRELGVCGVCGRTLTNEDSRAAGIGPKCAAGAGW
jgi:hypothetical protein